MKIRRFNEWVIERQFDEGAHILIEFAGNPAQELEQFARMPDSPQKKGFVRQFWARHKNKFKGAAVGAAGIATLILAGIPLESLIPFFGLSAVRQGMHIAGKSPAHEAPWAVPKETPDQVYVMADRGIWKNQGGQWQQLDMQRAAQEIKQLTDAGHVIPIHRDNSTRYSAEAKMEDLLDQMGVDGDKWWFPTEPFDPAEFGFDF